MNLYNRDMMPSDEFDDFMHITTDPIDQIVHFKRRYKDVIYANVVMVVGGHFDSDAEFDKRIDDIKAELKTRGIKFDVDAYVSKLIN